MATPSLDVYHLIQSLDKNEKGYYKKYGYKQDSKESKNEKFLFDLVDKTVKSEAELKIEMEENWIARMKRFSPAVPFTKIKSGLYYSLLASLREYSTKSSAQEKAFTHFRYGCVLYSRNLIEQSLHFFNKAEELAAEIEFYELLLIINKYQSTIYFALLKMKKTDLAVSKGQKNLDLLKELTTIYTKSYQYFQIGQIHKQIGATRENNQSKILNEIQKSHIFKIEGNSNRSFVIHNDILSVFSTISSNQDASIEHLSLLLKRYEEKSFLTENRSFKYLTTQEFYLQMLLLSGNVALYEERRMGLDAFPTENQAQKIWKEISMLFLECIYAILGKKLDLYVQIEEKFTALLKKHNNYVPAYRKMSFAYYLVFGFFFLESQDKVSYWYQYIQNNRSLGVRYDANIATRIMYLITLYEAEELDLLVSQLASFDHFIKESKKEYKYEKQVVSFFNKLSNATDKSAKQQVLETHKKIIGETLAQPEEAVFINSFDILVWMEKLQSKKSYWDLWSAKHIAK